MNLRRAALPLCMSLLPACTEPQTGDTTAGGSTGHSRMSAT